MTSPASKTCVRHSEWCIFEVTSKRQTCMRHSEWCIYDVTSKRQTCVRHSEWCMCTCNALYTMVGEQLGPYNTQCDATRLDSDERPCTSPVGPNEDLARDMSSRLLDGIFSAWMWKNIASIHQIALWEDPRSRPGPTTSKFGPPFFISRADLYLASDHILYNQPFIYSKCF